MVAQAGIDAEGRAQPGQRIHHRILRSRVEGDVVAGQHDQVRLLVIGDGGELANLFFGHERPDVDIGELRDPKAVKRGRQVGQADRPFHRLQIQATVEQAVSAAQERSGGHHAGGLREEIAPRRRCDFGAAAQPPDHRAHAGQNRKRNRQQESDQRTSDPPGERCGQQRIAQGQVHRVRPAPDLAHSIREHRHQNRGNGRAREAAKRGGRDLPPRQPHSPPSPIQLGRAEDEKNDREKGHRKRELWPRMNTAKHRSKTKSLICVHPRLEIV